MTIQWKQSLLAAVAALGVVAAVPATADAFCGFYVGGAGAEMFNDATQVVLLRDGTKTVVSMQNRYAGPLENFALVVPVPQVLMEANVKTLDEEIFTKIDTLTSPRLVEYWEQDPCNVNQWEREASPTAGGVNNGAVDDADGGGSVVVEAQFKVGEYEIVILSTEDSTALETWLDANDYSIPDGAAPYFEPYVQSDMYFFVAKVDVDEVTFKDGQAVLSPLRFHYDTADFALPVRLGMINSAGKQDLIVYTLGKNQRYELANYPNTTIPTNIEVVDDVRNDFPGFYRSLFERTVKENPGAAITEYAWPATGCDPCPGPVTLQPEDLETLGADVVGDQDYWSYVVTRIHMRYDKDDIGEDLMFKEADPIVGGREWRDQDGKLETGATPDSYNNFQARYIIRHRWEGEVACADPQFGIWGGDPNAEDPWAGPSVSSNPSPNTTGDAVFADGSVERAPVEELVAEDIPEIGVKARPPSMDDLGAKGSVGCSAAASPESVIPGALLALLGLGGMVVGRRRKRTLR